MAWSAQSSPTISFFSTPFFLHLCVPGEGQLWFGSTSPLISGGFRSLFRDIVASHLLVTRLMTYVIYSVMSLATMGRPSNTASKMYSSNALIFYPRALIFLSCGGFLPRSVNTSHVIRFLASSVNRPHIEVFRDGHG